MTRIKVESENGLEEESEVVDSVLESESVEAAALAESGLEGDDGSKVDLVDRLRKELAEQQDRTLRLQAEYENYRKRMGKEIMLARQQTRMGSALPILNLFDSFDRAVEASKDSGNTDAIREGLEMILKEFGKALEELGIQRFDASGKFDPLLHEAVSTQPSEDVPDGTILRQWKPGYRMGDMLIRAASVVVSSGPASDDSGETK
jgi:molecular chaperone GrpE